MHWGENEISERTEKSSMSLAEVLAMKQETEEAILKELQLFQNNTKLPIKDINIGCVEFINGKVSINSVRLKVEL